MATTIATVTHEGLALTPEIMAKFNLKPGTQITITLPDLPSSSFAEQSAENLRRLIAETRGMFRPGQSLEDEYFRSKEKDKW